MKNMLTHLDTIKKNEIKVNFNFKKNNKVFVCLLLRFSIK